MVVTVEFLPIVITPQHLSPQLLGRRHDALDRIVGTHQYPDTWLARIATELARRDYRALGMRPRILHIENAEMEIADFARLAVWIEELLTRHHAMKHAGRPGVVLPTEDPRIEFPRGGRIVRGQVHENQRIGVAHPAKVPISLL